jgi:hypothetical protein
LTEVWFPPDYPRNDALVQVFSARPADRYSSPSAVLDRELHEMSWIGFVAERSDAPVSVPSPMQGMLWHVVGRFDGGPVRFIDVAVLEDMRFHYVARLETDRRDHPLRSTFDGLVRSIQPLPSPAMEATQLHSHYVD